MGQLEGSDTEPGATIPARFTVAALAELLISLRVLEGQDAAAGPISEIGADGASQ
jgi:hypothetical protein